MHIGKVPALPLNRGAIPELFVVGSFPRTDRDEVRTSHRLTTSPFTMSNWFNRFYFLARPLLPRSLRMGLRRRAIARHFTKSAGSWPIDETAGRPPEGWPGWPDNKRFALVLTHDVEGSLGMRQSRQLADVERELGFRSSFNFVPEGEYQLPNDLRLGLAADGFEIGIHDLHHDGKLYSSRARFLRRARRINHYFHLWGARGFRSAFMLRRLDWLHDLDLQYDSSTFDTDPFEPQPDGAGTIFPFWIPNPQPSPKRPGYLELPYTLPQDSTLFLYLGHTSIQTWLTKLDWIVERGGMALVNVHPDYIAFNPSQVSCNRYPISFYRDLLLTIRQRYGDNFWHGLPCELHDWWNAHVGPPSSSPTPSSQPLSPLSGRRAAAVLYSYYPADPRPRRAAEALAEAGMQVDMICLRESNATPKLEFIHGVQVTRVPIKRRRAGKLTYLWQYFAFGTYAFLTLSRRALRHRYDVIHVHNMPDFLVFTALVPRLLGARVILDLHDPMPELCMSIFNLHEGDAMVSFLRFLERRSLAFAHLGITPNLAFKKLFVSRSCSDDHMKIVMNSPQESLFPLHPTPSNLHLNPSPHTPDPAPSKPFVVMFHGSLVHRHGLDLAVHALHRLSPHLPHIELRIFGAPTPYLDEVLQLAQTLKLETRVHYGGEKPLDAIAQAIRLADVGLIPNRRLPFTELNFPTRIFEYLALAKPVIAPSTRGIQDYFDPSQIFYFQPDDIDDLARVIRFVHDRPESVPPVVHAGQEIYRQHLWSTERDQFLAHVQALLPHPPSPFKGP